MSFLTMFRWYRRFRGGYWARVTGYFWGRRWIKLPDEAEWSAEERWPRRGRNG